MGIFDRNKKPTQSKQQKNAYTMESRDGQNQVMIFRIKSIGHATHRDNAQTNVYIARIMKYGEKDTIYFDTADYIGFELPLRIGINEQIMQLIMSEYEKEENKQKKEYYVGRVQEEGGKYSLGNISLSIQNLIYSRFEKMQQEQSERDRRSQEEYRQREIDAMKRMKFEAEINARQYMEQRNRERKNRIKNSNLKLIREYIEQGKNYDDYDGVNMCTGDVLRLRKVNKVGKDGSGTYLYSGYVSSTANEDDVEFFDLDGYTKYVCFELEKRLEDIVASQNKYDVRAVLTLLSNLNSNRIDVDDIYIGKVARDGKIIKNAESDSPAIRMKIEELKREYEKRLEIKRGERRDLQQ